MSETLLIGSLCSGYGGLDLGIGMALDTRTAWVSDIEPGPKAILAERFPDAPNLGDMTTVDWTQVEPVDIICGGTPCQDLSQAGQRAGMRPGTRSGLWESMARAIETLRPSLVVWENVRGALSADAYSAMESDPRLLGDRSAGPYLRAAGRVVGDLASLGYDSRWGVVRASDIGAPHHRARLFVLAYPHGIGREWARPARYRRPGPAVGASADLLPTPRALDYAASPGTPGAARHVEKGMGSLSEVLGYFGWKRYEPAIRRWETILRRPAPQPLARTRYGKPKLSAAFAEWMMGLPEGWITDVHGLSMTAQVKACGNGVVPQQAAHALELLMNLEMEAAA